MDHHPTATAVDIERRFDLPQGVLGEALTSMLAAMPAGLCIVDADGRLLYVDPILAGMLDRPIDQIIGHDLGEWLDPAEFESLRAVDRAAVGRATASTDVHALLIGGQRRDFLVTRQPLPSKDADVPALLCSIWREHDPVRSDRDAHARRFASVDGPPDLAAASSAIASSAPIGRALFDDQLRRELDLSSREHREFALVSIAIDRQQQAESSQQRMEQRVERLLRGNIRAMDSSFRVAANLFFMILSGVGLATAHSRVEALRRQCVDEAAADGDAIESASISIGVASFPHTARDREAIVQASENALAVARQRGGNQVALARIPFGQP